MSARPALAALLSAVAFSTAAASGVLCLTFDDSRFADWDAALPIFAEHGAHATFFAYHALDDRALASLRRLAEAGHSIGLHGLKHQVAPDVVAKLGEEGYIADEIEPQLAAARPFGLPLRSFAYPMSRHTPQTDALLLRRFDRLRGGGDFKGPFPVAEAASRRYLPGLGVGPKYKRGGEDVAAMLPAVAASNAVLVVYSHGIGETAESVSMSRGDLETILSAADALGVAVLGFDELDAAAASAAATTAPALRWSCSKWARVEGDRLIVDVPEGEEAAKGGIASAAVDLSPWDGRPVGAKIVAGGAGIGRPIHWYNGLKFQFEYEDPVAGDWFYPNTASRLGDFPEQEIRLDDHTAATRRKARLVLGLQEASGHAEFDLSTLRFVEPRPLWPVTNETLRCEYVGELAAEHHGTARKWSDPQIRKNRTERENSPTGIEFREVQCRSVAKNLREVQCRSVAKNLRGVMSPGRDMTADDFATLSAWGATLLRYQMMRDLGKIGANSDLAEFDAWVDSRLDHFENFVLPLCRKHGMKAVLDMHVTPGGRNARGEVDMFFVREYADWFVAKWAQIAERFIGATDAIYGYDLVNEPMQTSEALPECDFWTLQKRAAEAIRAVDPLTPVIVECNGQDSPHAFASFSPLDLPNVVYEVHMYVPLRFTHQAVLWKRGASPDPYPNAGKGWSAETLRGALKPVRDFQLRHGAKIYVGEFSAIAWSPGADKYLRDCIALFEEYGWDWTYHAFREWEGWSVEHEGPDAESLVPSPDNARKRALLDGLRP